MTTIAVVIFRLYFVTFEQCSALLWHKIHANEHAKCPKPNVVDMEISARREPLNVRRLICFSVTSLKITLIKNWLYCPNMLYYLLLNGDTVSVG